MTVSVSQRRRANLPVDVTSFIGRRRELAEVRRSLSSFRLVTLTGVGGVGKTRLAVRLAADLYRAFRDGVWLVDFASVSDPDLLAPTVATTLGLRDGASSWQASHLADHLADKQVLLVLDNCEHVGEECALLVDTLLRSCPELRVLATSRQALGIGGESTMRVPSLSVPDPERPPPGPDALMQYEAVSLLVERAAAVSPEFAVTADNHEAVARLCQRLDGIPLAIELAAVRLRALSVHQLLDRLDDRYRLLTAGSRAALPRQQTLRALIDWSFELMSAGEQLLWARMSVFAGSFEVDAVEEVCADDALPADSIVELMADLVDKSVLVREDHGPSARYRLLETIRQYGRDRLRESAAEDELRRRQRDWCRRLVTRAEAEQFGPQYAAWYHRFRSEHPNFRAVLGDCLTEPGAARDGLRIAAALRNYWIASGTLSEGKQWLQRLLAVEPTADPNRARALSTAGRLAVLQGDMGDVPALLAESRALAQRLGDDGALGDLAHTEGMAALFGGDPRRAAGLLEQALAAHRGAGELFGTAMTHIHLANTWTLLGDVGRALTHCQESLAVSQAHGERWCAALALWTQAVAVWWQRTDPQRVRALQAESIRMREPFADRWGIALSLEVLAWVAQAEGQSEKAARLLGALHATWRSLGAALPAPLAGEHARCVTDARQALGERAFDAAFQDGEGLALDEAVPYALGEKPAPHAAPAAQDATGVHLTRRETEIAELVAAGLSNKEIAAKLVIAQRTAEGHVEHILTKLGFTSRAQIAAWVAENRAG